MSSATDGFGANMDGLRERLPQQPQSPVKAEKVDVAQKAVQELNEQQAGQEKDEKDKKTYGRTPDGTGAYTRSSSLAALGPRKCGIANIQLESKTSPQANRARICHVPLSN